MHVYTKNPHQKKQMKNTHIQKKINKEIPQKPSSLKEKKPCHLKKTNLP